MYNQELEAATVVIDDLVLDPNNPRFWTSGQRAVQEAKFAEHDVQSRTRDRIASFGIEELKGSIVQNGFLPLDRIVVRAIDEGKYVAVEGNRRLAALKLLREEIDAGEVTDPRGEEYVSELRNSIDELEVLVYRGAESDISWILQGIRHISGIRDWDSAQRGKVVSEQIEQHDLTLAEAGRMFGLSAVAVGRLYRGYKALEQMREDDDYGAKMKPNFFTLFEEAYKNSTVREWLDWDDKERRFTNYPNLARFYSWITEDEDNGQRRIHDPRNLKTLARMISENRADLFERVESHEIRMEDADAIMKTENAPVEWTQGLVRADVAIRTLPNDAFLHEADELKAALSGLADLLQETLKRFQ